MAKTVATILGIVLLLVGAAGFFTQDLMGIHLTLAHNLVHLITGAISLIIGLRGSLATARTWCIIFGIVYGLLGVAGFVLGSGEDKLWTLMPDQLMFGRMDHIVHVALGVLFLLGGIATRGVRVTTVDEAAARR